MEAPKTDNVALGLENPQASPLAKRVRAEPQCDRFQRTPRA